jgi:hypothetical protein
MPLWGKIDNANNAPKFLLNNSNAKPQTDINNAYFVDLTEASSTTNRNKGIKTPGWNLIQDIGNGRLRVEPLVAMKVPRTISGDSDGGVIADS